MSGTSLDGVDAVLVDMRDGRPQLLQTAYLPYSAQLRQALLALHSPAADELQRCNLLGLTLARVYADCVHQLLAQAQLPASAISAIACHGQTIRHEPQQGYSLQLNQPAWLAEYCGIRVIADFRSRDIAAGGQGAPLVPAFHAAMFADSRINRAILNIGGISNVTLLSPQAPVSGFDCGPGNMLLDAWIYDQRQQTYDADGAWAASSPPLPALLERLLAHPYFALPPPKSCGREQFNLDWLKQQLRSDEEPAAVQASLLELTARSVQKALAQCCPALDEIYVCGGGAHNQALLQRLAELLPQQTVATSAALGLAPDWVEAVAFAWLGWQTLQGLPGNLPEVTGARGPRILGAIYPA